MSQIFIGIDQSFTGCGSVVLDETGKMIEFNLKKTKKDDADKFDRAATIAASLSATVDKYESPVVGLEGLAFSKIGDATRDLAGLQYTIIIKLRQFNQTKEILISPNELKKFATGKGKADKADMIDALPLDILQTFKDNNYKKTTGLADLADAYWIAKFLQVHHNPSDNQKSETTEDTEVSVAHT